MYNAVKLELKEISSMKTYNMKIFKKFRHNTMHVQMPVLIVSIASFLLLLFFY